MHKLQYLFMYGFKQERSIYTHRHPCADLRMDAHIHMHLETLLIERCRCVATYIAHAYAHTSMHMHAHTVRECFKDISFLYWVWLFAKRGIRIFMCRAGLLCNILLEEGGQYNGLLCSIPPV